MNAPTPDPSSEIERRPPGAGDDSDSAIATLSGMEQAITELRRDFGIQSEKTTELLCAIAQALLRIEEKVIEPLPDKASLTPLPEPARRAESPPPAREGEDWATLLLGAELSAAPQIETERAALLAGARSGQEAALGLIGQILLFRSATAERLPPLLKDVGEAYYRWEAESAGDCGGFRDELIHWLENTCAAAGLPNSIELARPGDRFDASRHNARERGAEVVRVAGWVVLRDNGKVYTKANVAVR